MEDVTRRARVWTLPNLLSMVRLALVPVFLWLVLGPEEDLLALAVLMFSGVTDYLDGWLARLVDRETTLGARLDIEFDAMATAVVAGLAVGYGQVPPWYLAVGLARYAFVALCALRRRLGRSVFALPERASRRYLYAVQFVFATLAVSPALGPPSTTLLSILVAVAFLAGFLRDWLAVTGRVPADVAGERSAGNEQ